MGVKLLHFLADGRVGGPGVRICRVQEYLDHHSEVQFETMIACPNPEPAGFYSRAGIKHTRVNWNKPKLETPVTSGIRWLLVGLWKDVIACRRIINETNPDLIHVNGAILLAAIIASLMNGKKTMWHMNDVTIPRFYTAVVRIFGRLPGITLLAASKSVVAYYRLPPSTVVVYPPAFPRAGHSPKGLDKYTLESPRFGVLANLSPGKGFEAVIPVFHEVRKTFPNAELFIGGRILENKRWYYDKLIELVKGHGLEKCVKFNGFVEDQIQWLRGLDVFVFASEYEAAPVAVIEAMACGIPVVAVSIPAVAEILGDDGITVQQGNSMQLTNAILELLSDKEAYRTYAGKMLERGKVFSVSEIGKQYQTIYMNQLSVSHAL